RAQLEVGDALRAAELALLRVVAVDARAAERLVDDRRRQLALGVLHVLAVEVARHFDREPGAARHDEEAALGAEQAHGLVDEQQQQLAAVAGLRQLAVEPEQRREPPLVAVVAAAQALQELVEARAHYAPPPQAACSARTTIASACRSCTARSP